MRLLIYVKGSVTEKSLHGRKGDAIHTEEAWMAADAGTAKRGR